MDRFSVNRETNKQWKYRLTLVEELAEWVLLHLNRRAPTWGRRNKKSTAEGRRTKAHQYVYEFLAVGKMQCPHETHDPLFTCGYYEDESMMLQLAPGMYPHFIEQVSEKRAKLQEFRTEGKPAVTWGELERAMAPATKHLLEAIRRDLCNRSRSRDRDWVDQQMIGLVLRYKCMGAFSDNLHGSVPSDWAKVLGNEFVECFASPFNHKFELYFSIYEQDKVFGSQGNFFSMIDSKEQDGMLPNLGSYEINPPWNNQMYERVNQILAKTLAKGRRIKAVIVGPNWDDTHWIPGIGELLRLDPAYKHHSISGTGDVWYRNDANNKPFKQNTVYWMVSTVKISNALPALLGLPDPKPESSKPHDAPVETEEEILFPFTLSLLSTSAYCIKG